MNNTMRYDRPAGEWKEGLPIGNGRLGAMICGNAECERLALNHEWLYKGLYRDREVIKPPADALKTVRALIKNGEYEKATTLSNEYFAPTGGVSNSRQRVDPYQPAGDLFISEFCGDAKILEYERSLDLSAAVQKTVYRTETGTYKRELFATYPMGVIAARISAQGAELDAAITLSRIEDEDCSIEFSGRSSGQNGCELEMRGAFKTGIEFTVSIRVIADGKTTVSGGTLNVRGGYEAVILLDINTNAAAKPAHGGIDGVDFNSLLGSHIENWRKAYQKCSLDIKGKNDDDYTSERLARLKTGEDDTLPVLYFNFGRYLLLSSAGDLPPNLQGIWNDRLDPPWDADFHTDINLEMNYWLAEPCNLADTTCPLFDFIERLVPSAKTAASKLYGCRGVWYPIQTDAWSISTPEANGWAVWIGAAAWLALHYMERFEYSGDVNFLKNRAYPYFKECAEFYEDYLFMGDDGKYVIAPSQSPENRIKDGGEPVSILYNCSADIELCQMALEFAIKASRLLNVDCEKAQIWEGILSKLPQIKTGPQGELMEFPESFETPEPGHRHVSHLIGVFPGQIITDEKTPELFKAAKRSLELRLEHGGGHTGWSRAWVSCLFAVFGEAQKAFEHLKALICDFATVSLLDLHPPRIFQIDGNFGGAAAVANMLIRSDGESIRLLPALPTTWVQGKAKGFCAAGGFELDFSWRNGEITDIKIKSKLGGKCEIRSARFAHNLRQRADNGRIGIITKAGETIYLA